MFSALSQTKIIILATLNLSSANTYNVDQHKILLFGKELTLIRTSKRFKTTKFMVFKNMKWVLPSIENNAGKVENATYLIFIIFLKCFQKGFFFSPFGSS